ncbi:AAA family ATPase [Candidatus Bathyarchaeota archaeon]|nr:AAA family ATPase [Candidatus Bathyarchaeota archaeon]
MSRISTGSDVLDSVLDGGFPAGSLVAVTGPPGTGKTIFAANWIYNGVERLGCNGLYVSFVEGRKSFLENMRGLGLDFERLERSGRFRFLEMATLKEAGVPAVFEQILGEIADIGASVLAIDSFSAISQVIEKPYDARILVHTVLSKIVREMGCTTMIIVEKMTAEENYEPAEFLSDFIIHLNKTEVNGALLRCLKILKARGTEVLWSKLAFTLKGGFKVFRPLIMGGLPEPTKKFKIVMHGKDYYSFGIRDLDKVVGVMFRRGCYNLLEFERDVTLAPERLFRVTVSNVLNQGGSVIILPPQGLSASTVWRALEPFVHEDVLKRNLKIVDFKAAAVEAVEPYVMLFEGKSLREDMMCFWNAVSEFRRQRGRPVFSVVGFDTLEYIYGKDEILKILGEDLAKTRNFGDVRLNIIRPECAIASHLSSLADIHLTLREICGAIFLQGIKPKTPLLNIELHTDEEGSEIKLTPIL